MKPDLRLIGLDLGSSAIKGVLADGEGQVLAEAEEATVLRRDGDLVEVEPEGHYRRVCAVLRRLSDAAPGKVAALAMAAASGNTLLTDAAGAPLADIIHWMDRRSAGAPPAPLAGLTPEGVRAVTGWPCVDCFPLAHLGWLREHRPGLLEGAAHVGMDTDWLLHRLTGIWAMDHSTATTFHLRDQASGLPHRPYLERLGLRPGQLSPFVPAGSVVGPLTERACRDTGLPAGALVVAGSFDHPAAARGAGVREPGRLLLSCGTSWVGFTPAADRGAVLAAGLLCDPFLSGEGGPWGGIFSVPAIGPVIDWYVRHLVAPGAAEPYAAFNEAAAAARPGAGGLRIDLTVPPCAVTASRPDIARAVMEGAARALARLVDGLRPHGFAFAEAVMVGGPSRSPVWPGILAEATGLAIRTGSSHAGAQGAAILAGAGLAAHDRNRNPGPTEAQA